MCTCTHVYEYVHVCMRVRTQVAVHMYAIHPPCMQSTRRQRMLTGGEGEADWQSYMHMYRQGAERNLSGVQGTGYTGRRPLWQPSPPISDSHHSGAHQR